MFNFFPFLCVTKQGRSEQGHTGGVLRIFFGLIDGRESWWVQGRTRSSLQKKQTIKSLKPVAEYQCDIITNRKYSYHM